MLCQSLLELENDVVLLNGKIRFDGMSSLLISDKLYTPSRGTFVADGAQSLTSFSGAPQIAASGENSNSLFVISDGTYSLNRDIVLSSSLQWKITRDVVIDGRGYDLRMGPGKKPVIIIEPDTTVTFTNISFSQFDPSRIQVKGASRYQFNNDVSICLSGSIDSEFTCVAHGAVTVDGQGYGVSDSVSFVIMPHSQLQLKRIHFTGMHQGSIRMRDESSSLLLSNVECHLNSAVTFSSGSYAIYDNVSISGPYSFSYTSPGYFSLNKGATLAFRSGAEFHFCPEVDGDMCPFRALDSHCTLELDNASCRVEKSSFSVQKGRLKLHGSVELNGGGLGFIWGDEHFPNMSSIVYGPTLDLTISGLVVCNNGA